MEALRKNEKVSGYEWWLLQDFWMGGNGLLDTYYVPKHVPEDMVLVANMNAGVQLLVAEPGDLLPGLAATAPRLLRAYTSKETLSTSFHVSNYGAADIEGATLKWQVCCWQHSTASHSAARPAST